MFFETQISSFARKVPIIGSGGKLAARRMDDRSLVAYVHDSPCLCSLK
jgi:hypothetical protein